LFVIFHIPSILIRLWKSDGIEVRSQTICTEATSPTCVTETIRPTTLPLGSVGYENKTDEQGQRLRLDRSVVDRLRSLCGPGESHSKVILRLAKETTPTTGEPPAR
jgi:hypothetical protein